MTPIQTALPSRIARRAVFAAAALAALLGLAGCGAQNAPCPTKGWVTDRCAPFGEFRYGDKLLRIPNTEPNKYRWQGGLTYNSELGELSSPNLAFYWRSGKAAGRASGDWPVSADDLILFSLSYRTRDPRQVNVFSQHWRPPVPSNANVRLPFSKPAGLSLYTESDGKREFSPKDSLIFSNTESSLVFSCPSVSEFEDKLSTGRMWCSGIYFPQPGLRVSFSIPVASLNDWPLALSALSNLINSWDSNADQPTTR
jgi:hypothetical protein